MNFFWVKVKVTVNFTQSFQLQLLLSYWKYHCSNLSVADEEVHIVRQEVEEVTESESESEEESQEESEEETSEEEEDWIMMIYDDLWCDCGRLLYVQWHPLLLLCVASLVHDVSIAEHLID